MDLGGIEAVMLMLKLPSTVRMDSVYLEKATRNLDRQVNTIVLVLTGKKVHIGLHLGKLFRVNGGDL